MTASLPNFLAAFGVKRLELVDGLVDFLSKLDSFEPTHDLPHAAKVMTKERLESHYEDFVSF